MPPPSNTVYPGRVYVWDDDLKTTRVHGIGFGVTCDCGEKSPWCATHAMARGWLREHKRGCKGE